jgi:hypothetical protein
MKQCTKCNVAKPLTEFHRDKKMKCGFNSSCRGCSWTAKRQQIYAVRKQYAEKMKQREQVPEVDNKKCSGCKEILPATSFYKRKSQTDGLWVYCKACSVAAQCTSDRKRLATNKVFRLKYRLRRRIRDALNKGYNKVSHTAQLIGMPYDECWQHLLSTLPEGTPYDNTMHIDHIIPCTYFDFSNPWHQRVCFHWTNLQLLTAEENMKKGKKLPASKKIINTLIRMRIDQIRSGDIQGRLILNVTIYSLLVFVVQC